MACGIILTTSIPRALSNVKMPYVPRSEFIEVVERPGDDGDSALPPPPPAAHHQLSHSSGNAGSTGGAAHHNNVSSATSPPGIVMSHSWATYATHDTAGTATNSGTGGTTKGRDQLRHEIAQQRQEVLRRLHETGEIDTVRTQLRSQLADCGWRDEMRALVQKAILERGGVGRMTVDELVEELKPRSQSAVPENVKSDLMQSITSFIRKERGEAAPNEVVEVVLRPGMHEV